MPKTNLMTFLESPAKIRQSFADGLDTSDGLDAAVAFIGKDWADIMGTFRGATRVICWLSSTNTNPYAVEQMIARGINVRQLPSMHAKVYILKGNAAFCIVGSANLSAAALSAEDAYGQYEAAVEICDQETVRKTARWFGRLWKEAKPISPDNLAAAKEAFAKKPQQRKALEKKADISYLPVDWVVSDQLAALADQARKIELAEFTNMYQEVIERVVDGGRKDDLEELIGFIAQWTGHIGKYKPALMETRQRIRSAFQSLFNNGKAIEDRLKDLDRNGSFKLKGFALASLTMVLSWRFPTEYPPFNRRTQRFLADFGLNDKIPKELSPKQYAMWIAFAQELSARLRLPSAGHIDRIVWIYTRNLDI